MDALVHVTVARALTNVFIIEDDVRVHRRYKRLLSLPARIAEIVGGPASKGIKFAVVGSPFVVAGRDVPQLIHGAKDCKLDIALIISSQPSAREIRGETAPNIPFMFCRYCSTFTSHHHGRCCPARR